jgi:transglutaminase-like putative cysteine protease
MQYIAFVYPLNFNGMYFTWEQAYADPDDTKSEKIGVKFTMLSVTKAPFSEVRANSERFYSEAAAVAETLPDDPREAVIALDKYITETYDYDYEALESGRVTNPMLIDDIMIDDWFDKKLGVCAHYANFSFAVLRAKGIPARLCISTGYSDTSMEHGWHQALIDGEWLNIDSTWNDEGDGSSGIFTLRTDEEFRGYFNGPHFNWVTYE